MKRNNPVSKKIYSYRSRTKIDINTYYENPIDPVHNLDYRGIYYRLHSGPMPSSGFLMTENSNFLITENNDFLVY